MTRRAGNLKVWAALLAAVAAAMVVALAVGTEPARAAFPGSNGAIAFVSPQSGSPQVYRMNPDGFGQTELSDAAGGNSVPDWSSDGEKIVFENFDGTNNEIYWMNSDGSGETNLTRNPASELHPAFSPDGKKLAFRSDRDGGDLDIFKMRADGSGVVNLTDNSTANESAPSWQPDP